MYQYIQGWKIGQEQLEWLYKHNDWEQGLDLFGEKMWIQLDGNVCAVKSLWTLFMAGIIGKLGKGYYSYCDDDVCYVIYRFGWCWNSNQDWPTAVTWGLLNRIGDKKGKHQKIKPNLKNPLDKSAHA